MKWHIMFMTKKFPFPLIFTVQMVKINFADHALFAGYCAAMDKRT